MVLRPFLLLISSSSESARIRPIRGCKEYAIMSVGIAPIDFRPPSPAQVCAAAFACAAHCHGWLCTGTEPAPDFLLLQRIRVLLAQSRSLMMEVVG